MSHMRARLALSENAPLWINYWAIIGGSSLFTGILGWWTSASLAKANIRKLDYETKILAKKTENDTAQAEANRSVDFEKALNERASRLLDSLEKQIAHLSEIVETQNKQLQEQSVQIQGMELEIKNLRTALDGRTEELHHITLKHAGRV